MRLVRNMGLNIETSQYFFKLFFGFFNDRDYDGMIRIIGFSIESSSTNVRFSIETLMEEFKPIVVEK